MGDLGFELGFERRFSGGCCFFEFCWVFFASFGWLLWFGYGGGWLFGVDGGLLGALSGWIFGDGCCVVVVVDAGLRARLLLLSWLLGVIY